MIKLKKLLIESEDPEDVFSPEQIKDIHREIQSKAQYKTPLYRGIKTYGFTYRNSQIRGDRKLKDTRPEVNAVSTAFNKTLGFNIPDRRQCLYAINDSSFTGIYGSMLTLIFPAKDSTVIYNPKYSDSYNFTDTQYFSEYNIQRLIDNGTFNMIYKESSNKYVDYFAFFNALNGYISDKNIDSLYGKLSKMSFGNIMEQLRLILDNEFTHLDNTVIYILQRQLNFFTVSLTYAQGIEVLKESDDIQSRSEFIIYGGGDYFQVNYNKFINSFEWKGSGWETK